MDITSKEELVGLLETTEGFVVVDFWAEWCGPCRMLANHFGRFGEDFPEVTTAKVEVDKIEGISQDYTVQTIPTIIYFKDGVEVARLTGRQNIKTLSVQLQELQVEE